MMILLTALTSSTKGQNELSVLVKQNLQYYRVFQGFGLNLVNRGEIIFWGHFRPFLKQEAFLNQLCKQYKNDLSL